MSEPQATALAGEKPGVAKGRGRISAETVLAVGWLILAAGWVADRFGWAGLLDMSPDGMVVLAGAALVPPALLLLVAELRWEMGALGETARALSQQLESFIHPSEAAEARAQEAGLGLRRQAEALTAASSEAAAKIEEAAGRLGHRLEACSRSVEDATRHANEARFGLDTLAGRLVADAEKLAERVAIMETGSTRIAEIVAKSGEGLTEQVSTISAPIDAAVARLAEASTQARETLAREIQSLMEASETARTGVEGVAPLLSSPIADLRAVAAELAGTGEALGERTEAVKAISADALAALGAVREGLDREAEHLAAAARQAGARIEEIGEALRQQVAEVEARSEKAREELAVSTDAATAGHQALAAAAEAGSEATQAAVERVRSAGAVFDKFEGHARSLGQTLGRQSESFAEMSEEVLKRSQDHLAAIEARIAAASSGAGSLAGRIDALAQTTARGQETTEALRGKIEALTQAADRAVHEIQDLSDHAAEIVASIGATGARAGEAGAIFETRATALRATVADLSDAVKQAQEASTEAQREGFLRSATFIVETMHSLAVDLTRLLEREVPDGVWKRFHAGDRSVFTRHLLQLQQRGTEGHIRQKFDEDSGFRDYVQRYLREFEGLLAQAKQCDHQDVLSSTFVTADVGKLYLILANAVGRLKP